MIQSMTGYGKATAELSDKKINIEIKSLNSKAMDLSARIAPLYREKEMEIRNEISKMLERGKVDFSLWIEKKDAEQLATPINQELVEAYYKRIKEISAAAGKSAAGEKAVLFLESVYTSRLNDIEKEEVMKLAVSLTTQKAAELGVVAVLARKYLGCYERDEYVLAPFYVYISKSKNGWQYLDSLGGAAYTSAKEEYVEHPFLVTQTAMHHTGANNRNEVDYE